MPHGNCGGAGVSPAVRQRQQDVRDAQALGLVLGGAADQYLRLAVGIVAHLDLGPAQALSPTGAQALEDRLLGGPTAREMLGGVPARLAVPNLPFGVNPRQ